MAFKMKGSPMQRNFPGAFKDTDRAGHPEHHLSKEDRVLREQEIFDPNQAGNTKRERKRGAHGSSRKDAKGKFIFNEPTRNAADEGAGSFEDINLLPEAEVITEKDTRKEGKSKWKAEGGGKDQFKVALKAWKAGDKEGDRPKRKDYKTWK